MRRFFLHFHNGIGFAPDEEGRELPDIGAAREAAIRAIRDVMSEEVKAGRIDLRGYIEIVEEARGMHCRVPFSSAVDIYPEEQT